MDVLQVMPHQVIIIFLVSDMQTSSWSILQMDTWLLTVMCNRPTIDSDHPSPLHISGHWLDMVLKADINISMSD